MISARLFGLKGTVLLDNQKNGIAEEQVASLAKDLE